VRSPFFCHDISLTFDRFSEDDTAIDYFGKQLLAAGYNYYGNEPMYSGITGQEFAADIYFGVVYYQRLRHMVLDKFQVRTTGPVDPITRQPVKVRIPVQCFWSPLASYSLIGSQTCRRNSFWRNGARCTHCSWHLVSFARPLNELLRLFHCLGLSNVR
jgi:hypothetical protein